jgi:asparagine N-glycosylation enzyme membrane subunit Stt3
MANLWATTFFLLWIDPVFYLSVQLQSFLFLKAFSIGLLFIYLFFFILHSLDVEKRVSREVVPNEEKALDLMLFFWMLIDFIISILLISNSAGNFKPKVSLSIGFLAVCFLNYLIFIHLEKNRGKDYSRFSGAGRWVFVAWFCGLLSYGIFRDWFP